MSVLRTTVILLFTCCSFQRAFCYYQNDSITNTVDPLIVQLDSMSYSLFTRDKFFANDDELLASINMPIELIPKYTEADIREKMMLIPADFPLTYNSQVNQFIDMFAYKRRGLMARSLANSQIYFPIFEATLDKYNLPLELKYLPIVESALNPIAVSKAGATGLWQFMYGTGAMMGMEMNTYVDDRRDPIKSTDAAARFLKKLYDMYGDWHLVLAAYNSGPGNVNKAIARAGGVKNFWAIYNYLPAETRSYVPSFIAAVYVMENHKDYKLVSAEPKRELYAIDTVYITSKVSLKHISNVLGIAEDELQFLNPSLKRAIVPYTANGFALNLPINYFALFESKKTEIMNDTSMIVQNTEAVLAAAPKLIYYKVKKNETINKIAAKYGVSVSNIKKWNKLKNSYVYYGQKLKIYTNPIETQSPPSYAQAFAPRIIEKIVADSLKTIANADTQTAAVKTDSVNIANTPVAVKAPTTTDKNCNCIYYVVQPGDTLWNIAQRYNGVSVDKLKADNSQINSSTLKTGDVIKIAF